MTRRICLRRTNSMFSPTRLTKRRPARQRASRTRPFAHRSVWRLGLAALLLIAAGVAYGASQHLAQSRQVMRTTQQQRDFVPTVRVAKARAADSEMIISLPGTTLAFAAAIFCTCQRLHRDAQGRHWRSCEGRRSAGADYGARTRSPDLPGSGHARPEPGDVAAGAG